LPSCDLADLPSQIDVVGRDRPFTAMRPEGELHPLVSQSGLWEVSQPLGNISHVREERHARREVVDAEPGINR
jgi:hypothetical protein